MKKWKNSFLTLLMLLLIINISFNNSSTLNQENDIWNPDSLYAYVKENFLSENNQKKSYYLKHMLVDPENYLQNKNTSKIIKQMEYLYDKLKINNYIFLISHVELSQYKKNHIDEVDMNAEVERFVSKFNYIMYRDNSFYEDNMTLTIIFFIKDRKMRMRTGRSLREIIKDKDALHILNKRRDDLRNEDYYKAVYDLVNDVYNTYISNYAFYNSFFYKNSSKIFYTILFIIITIVIFIGYLNYIPESERERKIKEFLNRNKNNKIKRVFNESCIICLEKFMPEEDKLKIENLFDKKRLKEEKTNILECGHKFHEKCIIEWLKTQNQCPICRRNIKYDNKINKKNENISEGSELIHFDNISLSIDDVINDLIYVQRDAFPHQISQDQGNRIISNYNEEKNEKSNNNYYYDDNNNDNDFNDFNDGTGGATSDW